MASLAFVVDPDGRRREAYLAVASKEIAPLDGLRCESMRGDGVGAVVALANGAPLTWVIEADHCAVVVGNALRDDERSSPVDARSLPHVWSEAAADAPEIFDGFHLAVLFHRDRGLIAAADILGLVPLYYSAVGDVALVATSPELFAHHPLFQRAIDPIGLTGLLLSHGCFHGHTLLDGIRRLPPATALKWHPRTGSREIRQYTLPVVAPASDRRDDRPFGEQVDFLHARLSETIKRHRTCAKGGGLLLSGGRDSRLLAGYFSDDSREVPTVTMSEPHDYEARCAAAVASQLGFSHRTAALDNRRFAWAATLQARWEHLATGFSNVHWWGLLDGLSGVGGSFGTAMLLDMFIGGDGRVMGPEPGRRVSFDEFYAFEGRRALAVEVVRRLCRTPELRDAVDEVMARYRLAYDGCTDVDGQRLWRYVLAHGGRLHVGGVLWRLSFGAWPLVPVLDRGLLRAVAEVSLETVANRRAQNAILCRHFERLALLPYVTANADIVEPLVGSAAHRWSYRVRRWTAARLRGLGFAPDRRYNHRTYDFDGPGWRAIRRAAEPARERLADVFDMDELAKALPAPDAPLTFDDPIRGPAAQKMLVGLLLWAGRRVS